VAPGADIIDVVFIRPASLADLEQLTELAGQAGVGLTTLPKDRDLLARRIQKSVRSFERIPDRPGGESYLFVMQDQGTGRVVGASGIVSKVGGFEPFYAFQINEEVHHCDFLKVRTAVPYLQLVREHDGPAEIGSLFLHPDYRKKDNGRVLQLVRFLFLAEYPAAFESMVVSELRGVIDETTGRSPFWEAVGRHFFDIDFPRADYLSVVNKKFIADLMPTHSIYIPLLPASAQQVIGKAHEGSRPAQKNLEAEGFRFCGQVDIFDAGPCVCCGRDDIRTVRESRVGVVREVTEQPIESPTFIVGTRGGEFRAAAGPLEVTDDGVRIDSALARVLRVGVGAAVRLAPLRPPAAATAAAGLEWAARDREGSD
jgi:arginine N-succinyltransferase